MASDGGYAPLPPESDTLYHLPNVHRTGLIAVGTAALISFISTTGLFLFLTYKLLADLVDRWSHPRQRQRGSIEQSIDLGDRHYSMHESVVGHDSKSDTVPMTTSSEKRARNPFPLLIYNLLLAEMQTALGYTLNLEWVIRDGIYVGTSTCWAQGWLNNIGILSSSIFFVSISINTYLSVVQGWRPPQWFILTWITFCWLLSVFLTSGGIIATNNGRDAGGWYVRANTWCWVNSQYASARLWAEWAWILASIPITIILYTMVFWSLWRENRSSRHLPRRHLPLHEPNLPSGHHPAFLVYPFIYIACTSPLAIARLITVAGGSPSVTYYCIAGLTLGTNGFWNTILWSTTMLFSTPEDMRNTGLDQFSFIRTPITRRYGNIVHINGPASRRTTNNASGLDGVVGTSSHGGGWWWWNLGGQTRWKGAHSRNTSQQSLHREIRVTPPPPETGIQLDVVTTVEHEFINDGGGATAAAGHDDLILSHHPTKADSTMTADSGMGKESADRISMYRPPTL
ncbi:hypothetical protein PFICI_10574 [Pestalotiopsis fici W106-1]|uniref:Uncharacterized protein n=1 Tax=Pestalotiopsis fici (strain W106-1 / CGMCC3.15140) TaxID=1229662 RepID=W3WZE5_PESFW|nr:uncharacterized protein PFICI_10574 [Pestalotiopsis fici W106-1]ETS78512.1 hypothetical protein PFICI_10574 [Pestalotiopsis fici W106-1]